MKTKIASVMFAVVGIFAGNFSAAHAQNATVSTNVFA
jgi:hypothetical protein